MANRDEFVTVVRKSITYTECVMCKEEFEDWKQKCQGDLHENGDDKIWSICHDPYQNFDGWSDVAVFTADEPYYIALNGIPNDYTEDLIATGLFSRNGVKDCYKIKYLEPVPCYENEQDFSD